jgi:hypothetical protein
MTDLEDTFFLVIVDLFTKAKIYPNPSAHSIISEQYGWVHRKNRIDHVALS